VLKTGAVAGAGVALPTIFTSRANAYTNEPTGDSVTLGFNVPQTGPYADEGADELRAYELAVEHLNGTGADNGMLETFSSKSLTGRASWARRSSTSPATPRPNRTPRAPRPAR
jgi:branched-chain amino acid transport system substrate-binding protein